MNSEATLWKVKFRRKVSATIFYDCGPVFDHFRKVDDSILFGIMNGKDVTKEISSIIPNGHYYFFYLVRLKELSLPFADNPQL
ncbi:DUF4334 domain-containing protein [Commensalibacter sp. TBRC 16381]|uniref:DUF4334 domain-containing protein n=2 Tax=Commensalibacter oyaizuii TaxID=3043873 RepID=A0ABT6Q1K9_9PROT|nr:DUF4334 domain-containing protein [Commensalibacter sp. TBRC 16381]MDI2090992.1 DUF4334 domain-containing protein [Commensalibacter sp. TBRC 16381]